jgi:hypothetical protein
VQEEARQEAEEGKSKSSCDYSWQCVSAATNNFNKRDVISPCEGPKQARG